LIIVSPPALRGKDDGKNKKEKKNETNQNSTTLKKKQCFRQRLLSDAELSKGCHVFKGRRGKGERSRKMHYFKPGLLPLLSSRTPSLSA